MEDGQVLLYSVSFTSVDTMVFLEGTVLSTLFLIEDTTTFKFIIIHLFSWMYFTTEFCECWGAQNSIPLVSIQWKSESEFSFSPWFNWCFWFRAAFIWRKHWEGWTSKFFNGFLVWFSSSSLFTSIFMLPFAETIYLFW